MPSRKTAKPLTGYSTASVVLDTMKRAIVPLLALLVSFVLVMLLSVSLWWSLGLLITLPLFLLGLYDWFQTDWTLTRNYPVAARIRSLFHQLRPYLRTYVVEGDLEGTPFSIDSRNLVYARARNETDTHPFGTERDTLSDEYDWFCHSITPAEHPDTKPRVMIGTEQCIKPFEASVLNISAMSFGSLSAKAVEALGKAAKIGGFYQDTGEGGISPYHLKHGGDLVWEIGSGYFGCRNAQGEFDESLFRDSATRSEVRMTEIKLSQGAKPGHGGLLPGKKVTEEIANIRKIAVGQDCLSPRSHSAFSTPIELLEFAAKMRELSGGKPVGIKLCVGHVYEVLAIMKAMLKTQIYLDYIVVDGGEGGTGAAPLELSDYVGQPLTEGLIVVRNALVGTGLRDKIRLAAAGKVFSGSGLAQNMAIGADWCNAARAFMFSIGCVQAQRCHLDTCPTGITTQSPARQRGLVVEEEAKRAARFHEKTLAALADIVAAAGLEHPKDLKPHHFVHRIGATGSRAIDQIYPFLPENVLLEEPQATPYAQWWRAADADSFKPAIDISTTNCGDK